MKRSSVPGKVPNTSQLSIGELAINLADSKLYASNGSAVFQVAPSYQDITSGYYGAFYDTSANQVANSTTSATPVLINSVVGQNGFTLQNNSEILFQYGGTYNIQFSLQFINPLADLVNVNVWYRKNGNDVIYSSGQATIPNKHGSTSGQSILGWNTVDTFVAGDQIELVWQTNDTAVYIESIPAGTTPATPISPAAIVTITPVSSLLSTSALAQTYTPANNAPGSVGQIVVDSDFIYVCTSTNTWKRSALTVY